jgi:hypothetical protein
MPGILGHLDLRNVRGFLIGIDTKAGSFDCTAQS